MTHYATLGINNTATQDEIKSAYRKLAKQHHPDLGGDAAKFQAISEAYETLTNINKKSQYDHSLRYPPDNQGFHFAQDFNFNHGQMSDHINDQFSRMFGFNFKNARPARNRNLRVQIDLTFRESIDFCQKTLEYAVSNGKETITLDLPAGVQDQTIFQIAGHGDNANSAIPRGDLEVVVRVIPDQRFNRIEDHIVSEIDIDCFQSILGHEVELETPRNKKIKLFIPPGTQHGTQFGINDQGYSRLDNTKGKFIIRVSIRIPTGLDSAQIELVKKFNY